MDRPQRLPLAVAVLATCFALGTTAGGGRAAPPRTETTPAFPAADLGIDRAALPDTVTDLTGYQGHLFRDGRVFIAGQPDSAALAALPAGGVACVVNLRTPAEMDNRERVPFDEAAVLAALGVEYVHVPLGGAEFPYVPAAVDTFAAVLARHPGPVLLHCTVGWRASHLWVAYLVRHQGWSFDDAYARGAAIAIGEPPLDGLLGRPTRLILPE